MRRFLVEASLIALAAVATGCAHYPAAPAPDDKLTERVVVTGSRIPRRVDLRTGLPATVSPTRIYTREQLNDTGRSYDTRAALRTLDPSFSR